jgi:hypothetical protein
MYNPGASLKIKSKFEFSDTPTLTDSTDIIEFNVGQITAYVSILPPTTGPGISIGASFNPFSNVYADTFTATTVDTTALNTGNIDATGTINCDIGEFFSMDSVSYTGTSMNLSGGITGSSITTASISSPSSLIYSIPSSFFYQWNINSLAHLQLGNTYLIPTQSGIDLGLDNFRWSTIYSVNDLDWTSDKRMKKDIEYVTLGLDFVMKIKPKKYRWKGDKTKGKKKYGVVAQDIAEALADCGCDFMTA